MKNLLISTRLVLVVLTFFIASSLVTSCKDDDEGSNANEVKYENIALSGAQEVPAVTTTATGTFNGTYNKTTKVLTYTITHNVQGANAGHFHKGASGTTGPVVVPFSNVASPITGSTPALSADQEADLLAGNWYANIHSPTYPGGEIRGQVPAK